MIDLNDFEMPLFSVDREKAGGIPETALLSTSPGRGGGARSLAVGETAAPFYGGEVLASYAAPNFQENFDVEAGS